VPRSQITKLAAPLTIAKTATDGQADWAEYLKGRENPTYVNVEELRKAEEKQKERQEKRAAKEAAKLEAKRARDGLAAHPFNYSGLMHRADEDSEDSADGCRDIRVENLSVAFGKLQLLENTTLMINSGRRYGLVGRNGCGKSTLLRHISHREVAFSKRISVLHVEQEITGDETPVLQAVLSADVERAMLLKEEAHLLEVSPTSEKLPRIYQRLLEIDADGAEARASAILTGLSFTEEMKQQPTRMFSGGWRMRVALARALFSQPDLLLLDEPSNHLDFHAVIWLERFLTNWKKSLVIVSHQRDFLNNVATDIIHLHQQKLTYYRGNYDVFEKVANDRIQQQKSEYEAQRIQRQHVQRFIDRFRYNAKRASLVQSRLKMLEKMPIIGAVVEEGAVILPFVDPEPVPPPILQFVEVSFGFTKDKPLFANTSFTVDTDSRIALVGANGCGELHARHVHQALPILVLTFLFSSPHRKDNTAQVADWGTRTDGRPCDQEWEGPSWDVLAALCRPARPAGLCRGALPAVVAKHVGAGHPGPPRQVRYHRRDWPSDAQYTLRWPEEPRCLCPDCSSEATRLAFG
jgi:ATP-binding cassette subfamily F protein 3